MREKIKELIIISLISLVPTLLVWTPFLLRLPSFWTIPLSQDGLATIVENYDGPLYMVVAKTFYNTQAIQQSFQFPLPVEYYSAHFPAFPALIRILALAVGYPYGLLLATLISSALAIYFFHRLVRLYADGNNALFLTFVFAVFPARWLIVRSVGSADPLFTAGVLASLYYFIQKKYWRAGLWGALAQLTKSPGLILFISYILTLIVPNLKNILSGGLVRWLKQSELKKACPLLLIPAAVIVVFSIYKITYGDFWVYFKSGDNIHLFFPPFQIFNSQAPWVGTFWLEEIIFIYLFGALSTLTLFNQKKYELASFSGVFWLATLFISHRDLLRYSLPLIPLMFIAFSPFLAKREFKIAFLTIIIPVYLFSLSFISQNVMPISNWAPFL